MLPSGKHLPCLTGAPAVSITKLHPFLCLWMQEAVPKLALALRAYNSSRGGWGDSRAGMMDQCKGQTQEAGMLRSVLMTTRPLGFQTTRNGTGVGTGLRLKIFILI